jgi:hypothetical protein
LSDGRWGSCWTLPPAVTAAVIADALFANHSTRGDPRHPGLICPGCSRRPANLNTDASLVSGACIFVELIARLSGQAVPWW